MAVVHLTADNFDTEVLQAEQSVLVDFWASWCGPCQRLAPLIEELGEEVTDTKIAKLDVDEVRDIALQYRVVSIPTLLLFKGGEVAATQIGACSKQEILELIGK